MTKRTEDAVFDSVADFADRTAMREDVRASEDLKSWVSAAMVDRLRRERVAEAELASRRVPNAAAGLPKTSAR